MQNKTLTIKVPGKLMIAGEFAVLEPKQKLVAMAVDRFVYASLMDNEANLVTLDNLDLCEVAWTFDNQNVTIHANDPRTRFVEFAMEIALSYLKEHSISPGSFKLSIKSELDDESGIKYGLGSSAAVVTAVITAILKRYLPEYPSTELVFKLAAISHVVIQGNGSGADIAASSYGGIIEYTSFQAEWLLAEFEKRDSLTALIEKDWIYFSIKRITLPKDIHILIGWTGSPASTSDLVKKIRILKTTEPERYQRFLDGSAYAVQTFLAGIDQEDNRLTFKGIKQNRQALAALGRDADVEIETPLLAKLSDLAEQLSGAGKLSGAGGGDCGIAFMLSDEQQRKLRIAWQKAGIKPLTIQPYINGPVNI